MNQLRRDVVTGRWIIVDVSDAQSHANFIVEPNIKKGGTCPFCWGNEKMTPPEITAYGRKAYAPNTPDWTLRVVPNKFPALKIEGEIGRVGMGLYDMSNGIGAHEVIVESPDHNKELSDLELSKVEDVIWAYSDRSLDLRKDIRFKYILIFKNYGVLAGASLEHAHSQVIALPIVPSRVTGELEGAHRYFEYKERCVFCDIIHQEYTDKELTVCENEHFISFSPFVPRFPYELWIMPKQHSPDFGYITKTEVGSLAKILKETLLKIKVLLKDPCYNFIVHTGPLNGESAMYKESYHWHIEIIPRLTKVAGFEWGSGFYINPISPEYASRTLREVKI